jgi:hypothetical protein
VGTGSQHEMELAATLKFICLWFILPEVLAGGEGVWRGGPSSRWIYCAQLCGSFAYISVGGWLLHFLQVVFSAAATVTF